MDTKPAEPSLFATAKPSCKNCYWWEHTRRGKSCRADRNVVIDGRKHLGTPPSYWCTEYTPQTHARCGDCSHWTRVKVKGKRDVCSALNLQDELGRERSVDSVFCKFFSQEHGVELTSNHMNRVDGVLASFLDIRKHSEAAAVIVRTADGSGVLVKWEPEGPGVGSWKIAPVRIDDVDGHPLVATRGDTLPRAPREIQFMGAMALVHEGKKVVVNSIRQAVAYVTMRTRGVHSRSMKSPTNTGSDSSPAPTNLQDEPWGPMWPDLRERMKHLIDAGEPRSKAARSVRESFDRENSRKLHPELAARLEAQLKVAFRDA